MLQYIWEHIPWWVGRFRLLHKTIVNIYYLVIYDLLLFRILLSAALWLNGVVVVLYKRGVALESTTPIKTTF